MNKKSIVVIALFASIVVGIFFLAPQAADAKMVEKDGHRLYDKKTGIQNGCQAPGNDCTFWMEEDDSRMDRFGEIN